VYGRKLKELRKLEGCFVGDEYYFSILGVLVIE